MAGRQSCQADWSNGESYHELSDCTTSFMPPRHAKVKEITTPSGTKIKWGDFGAIKKYCEDFQRRHCGQWYPAGKPPDNGFVKHHRDCNAFTCFWEDTWDGVANGVPWAWKNMPGVIGNWLAGLLPKIPWWVWLVLAGLLGILIIAVIR
jgi:hypothetical protein